MFSEVYEKLVSGDVYRVSGVEVWKEPDQGGFSVKYRKDGDEQLLGWYSEEEVADSYMEGVVSVLEDGEDFP
ncbi:MAG: hypothetical protein ABEK01_04385 [Candidatus Nanohaloarchaea archaeon]